MKILAVLTRTKTPEGKPRTSAVEWWRVKAPLQAVAKKTGWQVDFVEGLKDFSIVKRYDLVWFSYMDNILGFRELIDSGVPFVVDFDDDFLHLGQFNPVKRQYQPGSLALRSILHIIQHSPHLSVSTEHLKRVYQKIRGANEEPFVLENRITPEVYAQKKPYFKPNPPIRIGWQGGATHYSDIFHTPFWGAVTFLMGKYERLEFQAMGLYQDADWQGLHRFTWLDGSSDHPTFTRNLRHWSKQIDIFVAPLEDSLFNASKSSIKVQECGIQKRPVVASNVRPYQEFHADSKGLIHLANTHREWIEALEPLIVDRRQREIEGEKLYNFLVNEYSVDSVVDKYVDYINYVVKKTEYPRQEARQRLKTGSLHILLGVRRFKELTGSELYYFQLAKEYVRLGHTVSLVANEIGNPLKDRVEKLGVVVVTVDEVASLMPDIVISSHEITETLVHTFTCPIIQVIQSANDALWDIERPRAGVDHYVSVREPITQKALKDGVHPDNITEIWIPIDLQRFKPTGMNDKTLLFVGTNDKLRVKAMADVRKVAKEKGLTPLFIGQGQEHPPVENIEYFTKRCAMTAGIHMGTTTLEGWACNKPALIYEVDGEGNILSKQIVAPQSPDLYDSRKVAQRILDLL